jgi:Flp pilus assembly protein TadG
MDRIRAFASDTRGVSAVELAILAPGFFALLLGIFQFGLLIFTQASLHYAVQKAARCLALQNNCPAAASYYTGPGAAPVFTATPQACGQSLTATVIYTLSVVLYQTNVTLSATSCFPNIKGSK